MSIKKHVRTIYYHLLYKFLSKILIEILPKIKDFSDLKTKTQESTFFLTLNKNNLLLQEFEEQFPLFSDLPNLEINIQVNAKTENELLFIIKSFKLYISNMKL